MNGKPILSEWKISEHTFDEVRQLDFGIYCGKKHQNTTILEACEILNFCKERNCMAEMEIKEHISEEQCFLLAQAIKEKGMENKIIIHRNQGEADILQTLSSLLPNAYISLTANNVDKLEYMIQLKLAGKKLITITNFKGRIPKTFDKEKLTYTSSNSVGIIFSEIKSKKEEKFIKPFLRYLSFVSSRFIFKR